MFRTMFAVCSMVLLSVSASNSLAVTATFEDLSFPVNSNYWNGSDLSRQFTSNGAAFLNNYNSSWDSWDGFAYSCATDTTTLDYTNQYSAITGSGVDASANYAVAFDPVSGYMGLEYPTVQFNHPSAVSGAYFTNTTYAALAIRDGYFASKKFGGETGNDADWFKLTISGKDTAGASTGSIDFYLADFRFTDNAQDYIIDQWTWVDLSALGSVSALTFTLTSSDNHPIYGMNTPGYFALDNLAYTPEPATLALFAVSSLFLLRQKRN